MATQRSELEVKIKALDEMSPKLQGLESRLIRFVGAVGASIATLRIGFAPIQAAVELERELANVRKTTNFTTAEINQLSNSLLKMSTRIDLSAKDLAKIAAAAGQQGLGREGVEGVVSFTESVARMASVLDITAEDAADNIGKIVNIFKIPLREIESAVSTFNEVSNNSTAKGAELLDVVRRIGDAAGTLKLGESVAIAATGLDFGQSPEVVGTAFAKVFSSLVQKQETFGRLINTTLGDTAENWGSKLRENGLEAFKDVLAAVRKLEPAAQQNTIIKLFGGGRIGSLVNKLVQDTSNIVLERNFQSAQTGSAGISAIREQATVLNTVKAQAVLTYNALVKASIDSTQKLLEPLIRYLVRLREGIESAGFQSFMNSVASGIGNLMSFVARLSTFVAELNINWGNFFSIFALFLGSKAITAFAGLTSSVLGFNKAMRTIAEQSKATRKGIEDIEAAGLSLASNAPGQAARFSAAWFAEKLGYKQLRDEIVLQNAAYKELGKTKDELASNKALSKAADFEATALKRELPSAGNAAQAAVAAATAQKDRLRSVVAAGAAEQVAIETRKNARIAEVTAENAANIAAIQNDYERRYKEIKATGREVGLKALRAERVAQLAEEQARHDRSLSGVQRYWAGRAAVAATGAKAAADAERLAYFQSSQVVDAAAANYAQKLAASNAGGAAAVTAAAEVAALNTKAAALTRVSLIAQAQASVVGKLQLVWSTFTLVIRNTASVLGTVLVGLASLASRLVGLLGIFGVIYTLADAVGVLAPLVNGFKSLAAAIGLYNADSGLAAAKAEIAKKKFEEERAAVDKLTEAYYRMKAGKSEQEVGADFKKDFKDLSTTDSAFAADKVLKDITDKGTALRKVLEDGQTAAARLSTKAADELKNQLAGAEAEFNRLSSRLKREEARAPVEDKSTAGSARSVDLANLRRWTKDAEERVLKARVAVQGLNNDTQSLQKNTETAGAIWKSYAENLASAFTAASANMFDKFLLPLTAQNKEIADARLAVAALLDKEKGADDVQKKVISGQIQVIEDRLRAMMAVRESLMEEFRKAAKTAEATASTAVDKNAIAFLFRLIEQGEQAILNADKALRTAPVEARTGLGAPKATSKSTGDDAFAVKTPPQESLKRRLNRAELEFKKAQAKAEFDLVKDGLQRLQALEDDEYKRGELSIERYFSRREDIIRQGLEAEIRLEKLNLQSIAFERAKPGQDKAELKRYDTQELEARAKIDQLQAKMAAVPDEVARMRRDAATEFDKLVADTFATLAESGVITVTPLQRYSAELDRLTKDTTQKVTQLTTEGKLVEADALKRENQLKAVEAGMNAVLKGMEAPSKKLEVERTRIDRLLGEGKISALEAERLTSAAIGSFSAEANVVIAEQERLIAQVPLVSRGSDAYKKWAADIAAAKDNLVGLNLELNNTARTINQNIANDLTNILSNLRGGLDGIRDAFKQFLVSIAQQVLNTAAKEATTSIMKMLGSTGSGGIGGFIAGLFGGGGKNDGSTPGAPLFVQDIMSNGLAQTLAGGSKATVDAVKGMSGGLIESMRKSDNLFVGIIGNVLTFLGTAFTSLIGAVSASGAGESIGGIVQFVASLFHTGGVVGRTNQTKRLVSPAVFNNARRYHSGGVVGLKPGEVPIIAKEGETVRTPQQEAAMQAQLDQGTGGRGAGVLNVWVVTPDQQPSMGPNDVVAVVADNLQRRGSLRTLVKQVSLGQ